MFIYCINTFVVGYIKFTNSTSVTVTQIIFSIVEQNVLNVKTKITSNIYHLKTQGNVRHIFK